MGEGEWKVMKENERDAGVRGNRSHAFFFPNLGRSDEITLGICQPVIHFPIGVAKT